MRPFALDKRTVIWDKTRQTVGSVRASHTHHISLVEYKVQLGVHLVVVERHKQCVDNDAQRDVELDERVEHDER